MRSDGPLGAVPGGARRGVTEAVRRLALPPLRPDSTGLERWAVRIAIREH